MSKLYFYYSVMNAGKSAILIQNNFNYNRLGLKTYVFIPAIINKNEIKSRTGLSVQANVFSPMFDFTTIKYDNIEAIFIDEAQFLTQKQVKQLCIIVDKLHIQIYCYGLRSDFLGEPFEGSTYLLTMADVITEIKSICECGNSARMNKRLFINKSSAIDDSYKSLCRICFYQTI